MEQYITIHDCSTGISKNIGISELYRILWGSEPEDENSLTGAIAVQDAEKRKLTSYVVNEGGTDGYVGIYTDASDEDTVFQMCSAELPNESADGLLAKYTGRLYAGNEDEENDEPVAVTFAGYRDTDDESKHVVFVNDNTSNAFVPMSENFGTWLTENEMEDNIVPMHGVTHAGVFHADDVFATALLQLLNPQFTYTRAFVKPGEAVNGIAYDIGCGEFDHHQNSARIRANGVRFAAFGLLWDKYGKAVLGNYAEDFDETFIQPLDASDNTGAYNALASAISAFNPVWNKDCSADEQDARFAMAVAFAKEILRNEFACYKAKQEAEDYLATMMCRPINKTSRILVMDKYVPVMEYLATTDYAFVVFPSQRGGFNAQVVPVSKNDQTAKVPFPQVWWGAEECNLPEHVTFCHASGFLLAADTEAAAIAACNTALIERKDNVE